MPTLDPQKHVKLAWFFYVTNKQEIIWLAVNGFFYGVGTVAMLSATYLFGRVVDFLSALAHPPLFPYLAGIVGLLLAYEINFRIGHIFEVWVVARIRQRVKKTLFDHTTSLSFGYFADRFAGEIAHKIAKTADAIEQVVMLVTNTIVEQGILFSVSAVALSFINPFLGLYVVVVSVLFVFGLQPFAKRSTLRANEFAVEEAKTTGAFVDFYANIATVKVYGEGIKRSKAHGQVDAETKSYRRLGLWSILTYHFTGLSIVVLGAGLLVITSWLYQSGAASIGEVVFISTVSLRLLMNVWDVGRQIPQFVRNRGEAMQNLKDLIIAPAILDGDHASGEMRGAVGVDYRDVAFGYARERPILNSFSVSIRAREKLGIVGLSGAGKTTFANLLLRFFDVTGGAILLNGRDIREFSQEYLRSHISYISQDTSLFHATIAENIAYGSSAASQKDIERAATLAFADEFIAELPEAYESVVGERGIKLSGGERQRIAIARALLADRPVFLLDEATSALDSDSEQKIQKGLAKLMEGKTVIAIAHRLSTLSHMNRIVYLENGAIIEEGTHEELLAQKGKYAKLWHLQAGGFLPSDAAD